MRIPKAVQNAINAYYAFQGRSLRGQSVPDDWKDKCLKQVDRACFKHHIGMSAVSGTFFLCKGKKKSQISTPFLP